MNLLFYPAVDLDRLRVLQEAAGTSARLVNAASEAEALAAIPHADGLVGKITPDLLAAAPRLRWVQAPTSGLEHYLFPELVCHPCILTNARGIFGPPMADHVLACILAFARNLHVYLRRQTVHRWAPIGGDENRPDPAVGPAIAGPMDRATIDLNAAVLGLIGFGSIGREVARRAAAFGLTVQAVDPRTATSQDEVTVLRPMAELDALLETSDFVVITAPQTPTTVKMFNRRVLQRMRSSSYLINVARGAIVDLADLVDALRAGEIAGAALDVFETEPLPADHPLWDCENVIITPHVASASTSVAPQHVRLLAENIGRFVRGETLLNVVDKAAWY